MSRAGFNKTPNRVNEVNNRNTDNINLSRLFIVYLLTYLFYYCYYYCFSLRPVSSYPVIALRERGFVLMHVA